MDEVQRALDSALRSLSGRARSEREIVDKLTRAGYDERTVAAVMEKLSAYDLVDDASFARQWAASRSRRGMGPYRIRQELRQKGIAGDAADTALQGIDEEATMDAAVQLAIKHLRRGDERAKRRANDALVRRGYGYAEARAAIDRAEKMLQAEDDE